MKQLKVISSLIIIGAMLFAAVPAQQAKAVDGYWMSFGQCTTNNAGNVATGISQMRVFISDAGNNQVAFTFYNLGPNASSITDVYFDDGALLGIADVQNGPGVVFSQGADPGDLPGGNCADPDFEATAGFTADSDPPAQPNGVNPVVPPAPEEYVTIIFNLDPGKFFADVILGLVADPNNVNSLRIGIHVQGFGNGGSESFIGNPETAITLDSLSAKSNRGSTTLTWATGTELDNAGFNIYRSGSAAGTRTRLNGKLLAAKGDAVSGGSYSFTDASGYGTFYYWLEDVSTSGTATLHGPVLAVVTAPYRSPLYRPILPGVK